jgi:chitosanase
MNTNKKISFGVLRLSLICIGLFFMLQIIYARASVVDINSNIQPVITTTASSDNSLLVAKNAALQMTATLENSSTQLQFNYAENINDGRGITFGIIGFCTGTYDGNQLIKYYTTLNPNNVLAKYIPALDAIDNGPHTTAGGDGNASVTGLTNFIKDVQSNTDPLFKTAQFYELDQQYWNPAVSMFNMIDAKNNLTLAFIYDMSVRQGPDGAQSIINSATSQSGGTPATGINENTYLSKLITLRDAALKKEDLGDTDRDDGFKAVLSSGNVGLTTPFAFTAYGDSFMIVANANGINTEGGNTTKYSLTVYNGSGSSSFKSGQVVTIAANSPASGQVFDKWTGDTSYLISTTSATTTLTMPAKAISLTATYKDSAIGNADLLTATIVPNAITSVAKGTNGVQLISVKLTNTGTEDLNITGVEIPGSYATINEANTTLYSDGVKIGIPITRTDTRVTFTGLSIKIAKSASVTLTIKGDILSTNVRTNMIYYIEDATIVTAKGLTSGVAPKVIIGGSSSVLNIKSVSASAYVLTITNGTGSGSYESGVKVDISANAPAAGKSFDKWTGDTVNILSITSSSTTVTMPEQAIGLTATYKDTVTNDDGNKCRPYKDIKEGSMIRLKGGVDVYIVKYAGCKKFKRLILSPSVFRMYKHLKWKDVIDVDQATLDSFTTSNIVHVAGDNRIWELTPNGDNGKKSNISGSNYDKDSVYEINAADRDSYRD